MDSRETVRDLAAWGVEFQCLRESLDTSLSEGKRVFHLFAALAEFERDLIRERTMAGLAASRARGRKGGRPKGRDAGKQAAVQALSQDRSRSVTEVCRMLGFSRTSNYKYTRADPNSSS